MGQPAIQGEQVSVTFNAVTAPKAATLNYTSDTGLRSKRKWTTVAAKIDGNTISAPKPPADANTWFIALTDERGAMVSTTAQIAP
jgi:hypothetical protein